MKDPTSHKIEDRLAQAAESRAAVLEKLKARTKPATPAAEHMFLSREERRKAELDAKRREHAARKKAERQKKVEAQQAVHQSLAEKEQAELEAKRAQRKERKKFEKEMAKLKRDEKVVVRTQPRPERPYA